MRQTYMKPNSKARRTWLYVLSLLYSLAKSMALLTSGVSGMVTPANTRVRILSTMAARFMMVSTMDAQVYKQSETVSVGCPQKP